MTNLRNNRYCRKKRSLAQLDGKVLDVETDQAIPHLFAVGKVCCGTHGSVCMGVINDTLDALITVRLASKAAVKADAPHVFSFQLPTGPQSTNSAGSVVFLFEKKRSQGISDDRGVAVRRLAAS